MVALTLEAVGYLDDSLVNRDLISSYKYQYIGKLRVNYRAYHLISSQT